MDKKEKFWLSCCPETCSMRNPTFWEFLCRLACLEDKSDSLEMCVKVGGGRSIKNSETTPQGID